MTLTYSSVDLMETAGKEEEVGGRRGGED